mmetsp:Transcript_4162/g.9443  ORF Transcript_4162/g.9443 Transcript_4162/m.9443 type:complete len:117 (+) Transcript_4162:986-1336(+)
MEVTIAALGCTTLGVASNGSCAILQECVPRAAPSRCPSASVVLPHSGDGLHGTAGSWFQQPSWLHGHELAEKSVSPLHRSLGERTAPRTAAVRQLYAAKPSRSLDALQSLYHAHSE